MPLSGSIPELPHVAKVADEVGRAVRSAFESLFSSRSSSSFLTGLASLARVSNAPCMLDATDAQAMHAVGVFSNGRQIWLARVFKFCTMAAMWNSSRARSAVTLPSASSTLDHPDCLRDRWRPRSHAKGAETALLTSEVIPRSPRSQTMRPAARVAARQSWCWPGVPPCSHTYPAPHGSAQCSCRCRQYSC